MSEKLWLALKQALKLLYSSRHSLKQKRVFLVGQPLKVFRPVITSNTIKMMNYPSTWQRFPMDHFPNNNMFRYIATFACMVMLWLHDINVALVIYSATLPPGIILTFSHSRSHLPGLPFVPQCTAIAPSGIYRAWFPTVNTGMSLDFFLDRHVPILASSTLDYNYIKKVKGA